MRTDLRPRRRHGALVVLSGYGGAQGATADNEVLGHLQFRGQDRYHAAVRIRVRRTRFTGHLVGERG